MNGRADKIHITQTGNIRQRYNGGQSFARLSEVVKLWRTPMVQDSKENAPPIQVGQNKQTSTKCTGRVKARRTIKPRFRRGTNGIPDRVDIVRRWPARPGEKQQSWEPPRVSGSSPYRAKRLKALGNAVVPAQVFPLAVAIREWLEFTELNHPYQGNGGEV